MRAVALDDEPIALGIIQAFCERNEQVDLQKAFTKVTDARRFLQKFPVDLIFLDINMPEMNGIEFLEKVSQKTMVIFTTAYSDYAVKGFELNANDYLLKPFSYERFSEAVQRASEQLKAKKNSFEQNNRELLIRADYQLISIDFDQIELVESLADYIKICLKNSKSITVRMTMKSILDMLPQSEFIRVHRSYIIPIRRIQLIRNKIIHLDGMQIQVGNSYEESVISRFSV